MLELKAESREVCAMSQDHYEILQVHPRADPEAIAAAYARLRNLYDPGRLDGAAEELVELARRKRDEIERAYAVLSDPVRRAAFDAAQAALLPAGQPAVLAPGSTTPLQPAEENLLDYRPLPPAGRAERPRDFDTHPVRSADVAPTAQASIPNQRALLALGAMLALVLGISLAVTGVGPTPPVASPTPVASTTTGLDQFEGLIPELQRAAEQNPSSAQAWIDYGNVLYNSAEIVRENAPESELYQQRLVRWLQATEAYSRALALEPNNPATRADLGASACFYGAGTGDQSFVQRGINETRQAAQQAPENPRVLLSLGQCLVSAQPPQTQEALASWRRVVQLAPAGSPLATQAQVLISQYDMGDSSG